MTPSQLAKEFAAANGFVIGTIPALKRYTVSVLNENGVAGALIAEVSGYPAVLNAMKAHVARKEVVTATSEHGTFLVERGELESAQALGAKVYEVGTPTPNFDECAASGESCSYSECGMNGETQCKYCGKPKGWLESDARYVGVKTTSEAGKGMTELTVTEKMPPAAKLVPTVRNPAYPGGRWYVSFNGRVVVHRGHATRSEALKLVRKGMGLEAPYARNWRNARVRIFYLERAL